MNPAEPRPSVGAVIVAAGESRRMGGVDKVFHPLAGKPLICYAVEAFEETAEVEHVVLVLAPHRLREGCDLTRRMGWRKVSAVVPGGVRRRDSVCAGLEALPPCGWVVVHDGARPCVTPEMIRRGLESARETGCAVVGHPAVDTLKEVSQEGLVVSTPPRSRLWQVQTPQVFSYPILVEAHRRVEGDFTDDSAMVEALGHRVRVFPGPRYNIKVTYPEDLALAERALALQGRLGASS